MNTIRGLLNKADQSTFPDEADSFRTRAMEMILAHGTSEALVRAGNTEKTLPVHVEVKTPSPYAILNGILLDVVAKNTGCRVVRLDKKHCVVFGFAADVERVEMLYTYLLTQLAVEMAAQKPKTGSSSRTVGWCRSFIGGFTDVVGNRLAKLRRESNAVMEAEQDGKPGAPSVALVLANRQSDVDALVKERFPRLRSGSHRQGNSHTGRVAGHAVGAKADLGGARLAGRRALT